MHVFSLEMPSLQEMTFLLPRPSLLPETEHEKHPDRHRLQDPLRQTLGSCQLCSCSFYVVLFHLPKASHPQDVFRNRAGEAEEGPAGQSAVPPGGPHRVWTPPHAPPGLVDPPTLRLGKDSEQWKR